MDLLDFINKYWTVLGGISSVIATILYIKWQQGDTTTKMKEQKEYHDKQISELNVRVTATEVRVDNLKDQTFSVISLIQQDIREIMTILKTNK